MITQQINDLAQTVRDMHGAVLMAQEVSKEALSVSLRNGSEIRLLSNRFDQHVMSETVCKYVK